MPHDLTWVIRGGNQARLPTQARHRWSRCPCVAVYLIGEAAERLAADLAPAAERGVRISEAGTLETAVAEARSDAERGEVVLLSPACASFDAFRDFEERGDRFRTLVEGLR